MDFTGKAALITGAASGMGAATAREFRAAGGPVDRSVAPRQQFERFAGSEIDLYGFTPNNASEIGLHSAVQPRPTDKSVDGRDLLLTAGRFVDPVKCAVLQGHIAETHVGHGGRLLIRVRLRVIRGGGNG